MEVKVTSPVYINFVHLIKNEDTGKDKYWTFQIGLGKTGYGDNVKDRYRNGRCYDVSKNLKIENGKSKNGKEFGKAKLYNCVFDIIDYDSVKYNKTNELGILKKFDDTAGEPSGGEDKLVPDNENSFQSDDNQAFGTQIIATEPEKKKEELEGINED